MKEYMVRFCKYGSEEQLVILPSFWKLLIWFVRTAGECQSIIIVDISECE